MDAQTENHNARSWDIKKSQIRKDTNYRSKRNQSKLKDKFITCYPTLFTWSTPNYKCRYDVGPYVLYLDGITCLVMF